tara:strand:+ start:3447 stop:3614 length:168 start_codon:yes stop_codon:yes gene_type:complete
MQLKTIVICNTCQYKEQFEHFLDAAKKVIELNAVCPNCKARKLLAKNLNYDKEAN